MNGARDISDFFTLQIRDAFNSGVLFNRQGRVLVAQGSHQNHRLAHVIEKRHAEAAETALYRPSSDFVGDYCGSQECAFVPLENR